MASCLFGASPHLSSLALETANALLSPLGSHRERRTCRAWLVQRVLARAIATLAIAGGEAPNPWRE
ncbi:hypothetical protein LZ30DRAFT_708157 [Colletotrichum cereale]|nr:hypothetical protein LZ30DRAFT_708157 [Colletotrichum cereale]